MLRLIKTSSESFREKSAQEAEDVKWLATSAFLQHVINRSIGLIANICTTRGSR